MLSDLLAPLSAEHQIFNLFNYITFRTGGAILTALLISLILGAPFINWLKQRQSEGQPIRDDGPETHFVKGCVFDIYDINILIYFLNQIYPNIKSIY